MGKHHSGGLHLEAAQTKAERIMAGELQRHRWQEGDSSRRRKNDPVKPGMAARLRRETTFSIKAIAARVPLGTSQTANSKSHRSLRQRPVNKVAQAQLCI